MACRICASWIGKPTPGTECARLYSFCAWRCFRNEFRRVIRAFAARTASFLVDLAFESEALGRAGVLEPGSVGSTGAGIVELRSTGWTLIGPGYRRLPFCMDEQRVAAEFVRYDPSCGWDLSEKVPFVNDSI